MLFSCAVVLCCLQLFLFRFSLVFNSGIIRNNKTKEKKTIFPLLRCCSHDLFFIFILSWLGFFHSIFSFFALFRSIEFCFNAIYFILYFLRKKIFMFMWIFFSFFVSKTITCGFKIISFSSSCFVIFCFQSQCDSRRCSRERIYWQKKKTK